MPDASSDRGLLKPGGGLSILVIVALLSGCSTGTTRASSSSTHGAPRASSNVTPCNYAQVWREDPSQFSEFAIVSRFSQTAADSDLRSEGQQLASAVAGNDPAATTGVMGELVTTCRRLGLLRSVTTRATTKT